MINKDYPVKETLKDLFNQPLTKILSSIGIQKIPFEMWAGRTIFPSIFKGSVIRDYTDYMTQQMGVEGLHRITARVIDSTKSSYFSTGKSIVGSFVPYKFIDIKDIEFQEGVNVIQDFLKAYNLEKSTIIPVDKLNYLYNYKIIYFGPVFPVLN